MRVTRYPCPRCATAKTVPGADAGVSGLDAQVCKRCGGMFFLPDDARALLKRVGLAPDTVIALSAHFAGTHLPCCGCQNPWRR